MKVLFLSSILVLVFVFIAEAQNLSAAKRETDRDLRELVGQVHSVRIQRELVFGNDFDAGWIPSFTIYNQDGFIQESTAYDDNGNLESKSVTEFDSFGNKIQEVTFDANGKPLRKTVMAYDDGGNMIERKDYANDDLSLTAWVRFSYNSKGYMTGYSYFDKQGRVLSVVRNLYYRDGKLKAELLYDASGKLIHRSENYYNKKNVETVVFDQPDIITRRYTSLVNEAGDRTELGYDKDGKLTFKDDYSYERDKKGNWTKEICTEWEEKDGLSIIKRIIITRRIITYY